jgi:hypothetical protein
MRKVTPMTFDHHVSHGPEVSTERDTPSGKMGMWSRRIVEEDGYVGEPATNLANWSIELLLTGDARKKSGEPGFFIPVPGVISPNSLVLRMPQG